ncbi:phosphotransferase [Burkholderia gladioli]|uniref:phosphotransferase n=1 Tax=Burkholderia gladioli TaxID=28095 RepID=UPI00191C042B|nr:phosphotransferase [Burkholderia gladioli]
MKLPSSHAGGLAAGFKNIDEGEAVAIGKQKFGLDGEVVRFPTEKDDTFRFDGQDGKKYILKIANPNEDREELSLQVELLAHIGRVAPDLPVPRVSQSLEGEILPTVTTRSGDERHVRLLSYMPGVPLATTTSTSRNREKIGELLAALRHACSTFCHPADSRTLAWDVRHLSDLRQLLDHVDNERHRAQIAEALERFKSIEPQLARCRTQVLHNDFNTSNIVVNSADKRFVTGIIDFGDTVRTAIAVDVSTALMNQLPNRLDGDRESDFFGHARDVLRGYLRIADLTDEELKLIPHLAMARVVTRALLTTWRAKLFPHNSAYILRNTNAGWVQLEWFLERSSDEISQLLLPPGKTGTHCKDCK